MATLSFGVGSNVVSPHSYTAVEGHPREPAGRYNNRPLFVDVNDKIPEGYLDPARKLLTFIVQLLTIAAILVFCPWAIKTYNAAVAGNNTSQESLFRCGDIEFATDVSDMCSAFRGRFRCKTVSPLRLVNR